mgnify:CR=1 FL=1|jgi:hypothetical protein
MTHYEVFCILEKEGKLKSLLKYGIIPCYWKKYKLIYEDYLKESKKYSKMQAYQNVAENKKYSLISIIRGVNKMKSPFIM